MLIGSVQRERREGLNPSSAMHTVKTHVPTKIFTMFILENCCKATVS